VAHLAGTRAGFWTQDGLVKLARDRTRYQAAWPEAERARARAGWLRAVDRARGRPVAPR